jgi:hydroxymethylglutaryl-CoA lyase
MKQLKLIECPRDAMQGWKNFIPTQKKIEYINQLLKVGFDTIDFGSFVSSKAVPQMADTGEVVEQLDVRNSKSKLLAIIANVRGAQEASGFEKINCLGFPFSISPTFQIRNANSTMEESMERVRDIKRICDKNEKELIVYISMAFGNPYGDEYNEDIVMEWIKKIAGEGIGIISLADTVGLADACRVASIVNKVISKFPGLETGVHLHSTNINWQQKIDAALQNGCIRFDGALKGFGGCPFAEDQLVGNMNTELMITYFKKLGFLENINETELLKASQMASEIFI